MTFLSTMVKVNECSGDDLGEGEVEDTVTVGGGLGWCLGEGEAEVETGGWDKVAFC